MTFYRENQIDFENYLQNFGFLCFSCGIQVLFFWITKHQAELSHMFVDSQCNFTIIPVTLRREVVITYPYKVGPPRQLSWFITPITMVYGTYNYSIHGVYKPTNITGGSHLVYIYIPHCVLYTFYMPTNLHYIIKIYIASSLVRKNHPLSR